MGRNWRPKHPVKCYKCNWTGRRAVTAKACPSCGDWHPTRTNIDPITVLWHPEGKPTMARHVCVKGDRIYARSKAGDWWLLSKRGPSGWRAPVLKIKRDLFAAA